MSRRACPRAARGGRGGLLPRRGTGDAAFLQGPNRTGWAANARSRAARRPPPQGPVCAVQGLRPPTPARAGPEEWEPRTASQQVEGRRTLVRPACPCWGAGSGRGGGGGGGAQGPFVGGSTDDVTPTWDQSPWASALGSRPPSSPSSVPDLEPGESQPAAQGASARVTVCVCARHRLRALPSARRRRGPFWFTFWFRYFFAPLPSQPSLRSPPPLKSHKAVCNSIFSLLNFYLIHLEVLVEILRFHS